MNIQERMIIKGLETLYASECRHCEFLIRHFWNMKPSQADDLYQYQLYIGIFIANIYWLRHGKCEFKFASDENPIPNCFHLLNDDGSITTYYEENVVYFYASIKCNRMEIVHVQNGKRTVLFSIRMINTGSSDVSKCIASTCNYDIIDENMDRLLHTVDKLCEEYADELNKFIERLRILKWECNTYSINSVWSDCDFVQTLPIFKLNNGKFEYNPEYIRNI